MDTAELSLICHKCGVALSTGEGSFYIVRIEAIADPSPPELDMDESIDAMRADIELLLAKMSDMSEQELMDQVYRKLVILLCRPCYEMWIENPTGDVGNAET